MADIPVFSFVAFSGTGKTTYLSGIVAGLRDAGVRVGVLKHDGHDFELDNPAKDSGRLARAGAVVTAISSGSKTAWIDYRPLTPEQALAGFQNVDIVLTEGFKRGPWPKIALYRRDSGQPLCLAPEACCAIVSDVPLAAACPVFPLDNPEPMIRWLFQMIGRSPL